MKLYFVLLFHFAITIPAEVIKSRPCTTTGAEKNPKSDLQEFRVTPCASPSDGVDVPCKLKRGTTASISVDFVPSQQVKRLRAGLYYLAGSVEIPFLGLPWNGCKSLTTGSCPIEPNTNSTWTADVKLSQAFPLGTYPLKLKLTDGHPLSRVVIVCRIFNIELVD